ncbi:MAG: hypothetical protein QN143_02910, partial [Armatimonadota bacterium]|nr:hypothetical protein [Armatimonadota bacterium]
FMPAILGRGVIAQFRTVASFHVGFYLALAASLVALYDLWRKHAQHEGMRVQVAGPVEVAGR